MGRLLIRGEAGHDIVDGASPLPGENVVEKPGRSAFQHTEFKLMLNIKGVKNLVVCGVTTDVCVHSTIREANDNGFDCVLVEDCAAASTEQLHAFAVESIKEEGGIFGAVTAPQRTDFIVHRHAQRLKNLRGRMRLFGRRAATAAQSTPPIAAWSQIFASARSCTIALANRRDSRSSPYSQKILRQRLGASSPFTKSAAVSGCRSSIRMSSGPSC